jgi:hypothetical protein
VVRLSERAVVTVPDAPQLRRCPACGRDTFRTAGVCSRCDPDVPPLRSERLNSGASSVRRRLKRRSADRTAKKSDNSAVRTAKPLSTHRGRGRRPLRPFGAMDGRVVVELARELARTPQPERVINGLRLDPDEPRPVTGPASPWQVGNRCRPGQSVAAQAPARDKALALMSCPGEWEVLAFYQAPHRVKAAVWYLRHVVAPQLPPGRWQFARCWWEHAAVMGRYDD